MELDQVIKERRSVRRFKKLDVPWYLISECLDAANYAPSSGNVQNWRFVVVKEKGIKEGVVKACEEQYWMMNAPVLIVICSDMVKIGRLFGVRGEALYSVQNCAAAIENLLLKAYELGLGGAWIGAFDEMKLKEILSISDEARPQAIIALGFGDDFEEKPKRELLENVTFFEKYGQRMDKSRNVTPVVDLIKRNLNKISSKIK